jgi:hypothetical protein
MQNIANTFGNCKADQAIFQVFLSHLGSVGGLCCCIATLTFAAKRRNWRIPAPSALSRRPWSSFGWNAAPEGSGGPGIAGPCRNSAKAATGIGG